MTAERVATRRSDASRGAPHNDADRAFVAVVESGSRVVAAWLRAQMSTSPYATLGVGAFTGYVLGGGISPALGTVVVRGASRAMLADLAGAVLRGVHDGYPGGVDGAAV